MINIAELLKDAPKGTKLYSPLFGEVKLVRIDKRRSYPIDVTDCKGNSKSFTEFGVYFYFADHPDVECLLFPSKDCRTWEGWKLPTEPNFKVWDWLVSTRNTTLTYRILESNIPSEIDNELDYKVEIYSDGVYQETCFIQSNKMDEWGRLWTIEDAKDGDVLATDNGWTCIFKAFDGCVFSSYCFMDSENWFFAFGSEAHTPDSRINGNIHPATKEQRGQLFAKIKEAGYEWDEEKKELRKIQSKYDISNFHEGMPVLVREYDTCQWQWVLYSHFNGVGLFFAAGKTWRQCIPFNEKTKHLLGTTGQCGKEYINW